MDQEICLLNDDGEPRTSGIFDPLLRILFAALVASAEEVCITYSLVKPGRIMAEYTKEGKSFPLKVEANFSPADLFVRLRIICGLSIVAAGRLTGETMIRFQNQPVKVLVEINAGETQEGIGLKFAAPAPSDRAP
jgi:hypothetical protein